MGLRHRVVVSDSHEREVEDCPVNVVGGFTVGLSHRVVVGESRVCEVEKEDSRMNMVEDEGNIKVIDEVLNCNKY